VSFIEIYVFSEPYKKKCDDEKTNEKNCGDKKNNLLIFAINAAAPEGTPPRRINDQKKYEKPPCPGVPRRCPEAGNHPK
jgi:hypothetical protein